MKEKKDRKNGKMIAVTMAAVILLAAGFIFIEKSVNHAREQAETVASRFADAYFSGNMDGVRMYLAKSYTQDAECYQPNEGESADVEIIRVKGLQNIKIHNMRTGCHISVEFRAVYEDSLTYLEMDIVREKSGWKIASYGLEK